MVESDLGPHRGDVAGGTIGAIVDWQVGCRIKVLARNGCSVVAARARRARGRLVVIKFGWYEGDGGMTGFTVISGRRMIG